MIFISSWNQTPKWPQAFGLWTGPGILVKSTSTLWRTKMLLLPVLSLSPSFPSLTSNRYLQFRPRRSCRVVRWAATKSGDDEFTAKSGYLFELSATKADSLGNTRYQKSQPYARGSLCSWLATWCKPASHSGSGSVSATSILSWTAPGQCFRLHNALFVSICLFILVNSGLEEVVSCY